MVQVPESCSSERFDGKRLPAYRYRSANDNLFDDENNRNKAASTQTAAFCCRVRFLFCASARVVTKCTRWRRRYRLTLWWEKPLSAEGCVKYRRDLGLRSWEREGDEWGWREEGIDLVVFGNTRSFALEIQISGRSSIAPCVTPGGAPASPPSTPTNKPGLRWRGRRCRGFGETIQTECNLQCTAGFFVFVLSFYSLQLTIDKAKNMSCFPAYGVKTSVGFFFLVCRPNKLIWNCAFFLLVLFSFWQIALKFVKKKIKLF